MNDMKCKVCGKFSGFFDCCDADCDEEYRRELNKNMIIKEAEEIKNGG